MDLRMNQIFREKFPEIELINLSRNAKTEATKHSKFPSKNDIVDHNLQKKLKSEPEIVNLDLKCGQGSQTNSSLVSNLPRSDSEPSQWAGGIENEAKMEHPSTPSFKTEKIDTEPLDLVPKSGQGSQNNSSRKLPSSKSKFDQWTCNGTELKMDFQDTLIIKTEKIDTETSDLVPKSNQNSEIDSSRNLPSSASKLDQWTCGRIENEVKMEPPDSLSTKMESSEHKMDFECVTIKEEPVEDFVDESAMSKDDQTDLLSATEGHSKPKLFNCSECSKGFDLRISLEKHELTHREFVTCDKCHQKFPTKGELKQHNLKTHYDNGTIHICEDCGRAFRFKSSYLAHSVCHTKDRSFVCDVCSKEFKQKYSLDKHKLIHTGIKPHVCKICSKGFTLSGNLIQHMRTHTAEKPYVCGLCSKKFGSETELNKHFNKHRGGQSFVCDFCAKPFNWKSDLARHRRIHTGDKPYTCSTCNKGFSQKQNLANHELIHLGIKPNECEVCQKSFSAKSALTAHMWSKHQIFIDKKAFKKVQPIDSSNSNSTDS